MSYSFSVRAATRDAAIAEVASALAKVVEDQPIHEADRPHAFLAATNQISLLDAPATGQEISVSVSGSVCKWKEGAGFTNVSISIHASVLDRAPD